MLASRARPPLVLLAALVASGAGRAADPVPEPVVVPAVLHLEDAVRLVRERGLDLLVAEASVRGAEGDLRAAQAVANPALSLSYGRSFTYGHCVDAQGAPAACELPPDPLYGVGLSDQGAIADALSGKRGLRVGVARAALEAARASREDARRSVEALMRQGFIAMLVAQEAERFAGDVATASARTLQLTQARYEAGAISEADVARVEVAKLEADQARTSAAQALRAARINLAFLLGVRGPVPEFAVDEPDLLRASAPPAVQHATRDALLERARAHRPDLAAQRRQAERAEATLSLARRRRFPDVQLSLDYAQQGTTANAISPPTLTVGISLPLPLLYQQQGEIRRADADLAAQRVGVARVEAQVAADVASAWSDFAAAAELAQRMEGGLLERAARARDLVEVQYRKGAASLLDYLDAQRTFTGTRVEYLNDLASYWTAFFRLEQAVGEELR